MSAESPEDKQFFKIGEVAEIVGVKPHVLRYWESEFRELNPLKTRGAHRMYRRNDVELACTIRRLVHEEGFTVAGARKRLKELRAKGGPDPAPERVAAGREVALRAELLSVRAELQKTLDAMQRMPPPTEDKPTTVTVTSVAPARVPIPARKTR